MNRLAAMLGVLVYLLTPSAGMAASIQRIDSIAIPVTDLDRSVRFYSEALDFKLLGEHEGSGSGLEHLLGVFGARIRIARLRLGEEEIELVQFQTPPGRALPADLRGNDLAFEHIAIVVSDMTRAYERLRARHVGYGSSEPQVLPEWNPKAGGIAAFYFHDPDGNFLELLHFPPGKGAARWQSDDALFLGIDHTAITVSSTAQSLRYYRDLLGLSVAGSSENYGPEQERLNNVFGAHLQITALRAAAGPGIELLEYITPQGGRPIPADSRANDRWYWQVNFCSSEPEPLYWRSREAHASQISGRVFAVDGDLFGLSRAFIIRDPDGHADAIGAPPPRSSGARSLGECAPG